MSVNIFDMAQTWNNGATTFAGIKLNVTDTASASASLLMDLQVGGTSKFRVAKNGHLRLAGSGFDWVLDTNTSSQKLIFSANGVAAYGAVTSIGIQAAGYNFGASITATVDLSLVRDAANTLAQRNGTAAQTFNIYNTYTDASNYERVAIGWAANIFSISPGAAGTGSTRVIHISGLPTSNPGPGILWNNSGTPAIGT